MSVTTETALPTFEQLRDELRGVPPTTEQLKEHFAPVLDRIATGVHQREEFRALAFDAVEELRLAGFTRVHLPLEHGGLGASMVQLFELFIDVATADSNLPQALHSHFLYTEIMQNQDQGPITSWWLKEVAQGTIFGNALVELPPVTGYRPTVLTEHLNGDKFYTTGALFSDYLVVSAQDSDGETVLTVVEADHPGVTRVDDWNGFGQRLTASGTTTFNEVPFNPEFTVNMKTPSARLGYPLVWLILAATQVGIGHAALRDISAYVAARRRTYGHATAETPAEDPLVHQVVGSVSAQVAATRHIVLGAAAQLELAFAAVQHEDSLESEVFIQAHTAANIAVSQATIVTSDLILDATNQIFESGGASSLDASKQLHRHWLNARVIGSHTPLIYRRRLLGDYHINGTVPPTVTTARDSAPAETASSEAVS